jgi:Phosphoglucomutase/phosphomannomutase, alpha/beta/alpha domain III
MTFGLAALGATANSNPRRKEEEFGGGHRSSERGVGTVGRGGSAQQRAPASAGMRGNRGVRRVKADVALGFDGDGDRCGVVDNEGEEIFADKVGVMLAHDISAQHKGAAFVADVKSTGLFMTDPVLRGNGAKADYWKTGHSYMKRRVNEIGAMAGFEKSGHFLFNEPLGRCHRTFRRTTWPALSRAR